MMGFHDPGDLDLTMKYEAELGKPFPCILVYMKPSEWGTVSPEFRQVVAAGKLAVASHTESVVASTDPSIPATAVGAGVRSGGGEVSTLGVETRRSP